MLLIIFAVWGVIGYFAWREAKPKTNLSYNSISPPSVQLKRKYVYNPCEPKPIDFARAKKELSPENKQKIQRNLYQRKLINDAFMLGVFFGTKIEKKRAEKPSIATPFMRE